ncbi:MAG: cytidine deaminase [Opitutae bacterium]|nr:cytidine deaminase [Opitutae bacterium]
MSKHSPNELLETAAKARHNAHSKYSKFAVGSALLTEDGSVFLGCNVENASYGLTICAERVALTSAIAAGHKSFQAIAIVADKSAAPCGACRQVLAEFCQDDFPVYVASAKDSASFETHLMEKLLPARFHFTP